jgi:hypothetical protein
MRAHCAAAAAVASNRFGHKAQGAVFDEAQRLAVQQRTCASITSNSFADRESASISIGT